MQGRKILFHGGVKVEIRGMNIERFFNIAAQREIFIRDVETKEDGTVTFWTTPKEFKNMKAVAKKAGVRLKIIGRSGLPFFLYRNRKRKLLVAGACSFFLLLYMMSFFIWDISFEGNHRFTDEMLLHYMETLPVGYGMKKSDISCDELEGKIRNHFTEITWVSAEMKGTRLVVRVKENEALLAPVILDDAPCDLAAEKSGTIVRTVVRSGFCQVKEGDIVEAGDLLVDGTIPIMDDAGTLVNSHEVHSDAEIYAETVHTIKKEVPLTETVKSRTGTVRKGIFFKAFEHVFYVLPPSMTDSKWEFVTEQAQLKIFEDYYLPFYFGMVTSYEYVSYEKNYTEEEVVAISNSYLQEYMENLMEKGVQILGSDGKIEQGESRWTIEGTLTVIEDIAVETQSEVMEEELPES